MDVLYERCCGLDVHKQSIFACLIIPKDGGGVLKEHRTFGTMTKDILALSDWLAQQGCTHVAMESTGIYWKPIYNLLEGKFELLVANAYSIKVVPGRKTDVRDAEWIADLLRHGLIQGSAIPGREQRTVRDLTRYRTALTQDRTRVVNRLAKILEDANIKLSSVATDITGVSARAMLNALLAGQSDPAALSQLARGRLRGKKAQLEAALMGSLHHHHRFLIRELLAQLDHFDESIERVNIEIAEKMLPVENELELLDSIPGIDRKGAEVMMAEWGMQIDRYPTANHLASWACMCPGNNESARKQKSGKTRKGNRWLRSMLVEAAHGASHTKKTYLSAQYHRLVSRRGKKRALVAVGHSILTIAYYVLKRKVPYVELGDNYFDVRQHDSVKKRMVQRLENLGYSVTLSEKVAA